MGKKRKCEIIDFPARWKFAQAHRPARPARKLLSKLKMAERCLRRNFNVVNKK